MKSTIKAIDGISGSFRLQIFMHGKLVEDYVDQNLVITLGRKNTARLLGGDATGKRISKFQAGTNGTTPDLADTAITAPFTKAIGSVTYENDNSVTFNWVIEATEANGMTISEFGLLNDDNILFARKTRTPIVKVNPMVLVGTWKITIN